MNIIVSVILLSAGLVLLGLGINASESLSSDFSRFFTGSPTDKTIWLIIGGSVVAATGAGGLMHGLRNPPRHSP